MRKVILAGGLATLVGAGVLLGGTSPRNPHGTLKNECEDCHTAESWTALRSPLAFDHGKTGFALAGAHDQAQCGGCHKDLVFNRVGSACADCHADHHQGQLGLDCQNCHTPRNWQNQKDVLELHVQRGFALTGVHAAADCEACHHAQARDDFRGAPVDCQGCHAEAFAATTNPNHMQAGFSSDCQLCHNAVRGTWSEVRYAHTTSFTLTGAHKNVECNVCHTSVYAGTPNACYDCHSAEFASTTEPPHASSGFSHECTFCHTTSGWTPSSFDHTATAFPLTGRHTTLTCVSCHESGYAGTPSTCIACHQAAYEGTTDPDHAAAGFSTECQTCHSTSGWSPSSFDHGTTAFPLTGSHVTLSCASCHASGYAGTPSSCFACHQAAYDATTDPNHAAAGFPTDCQTCHSTLNWTSSTWDHDGLYFPIYSGAHNNRWDACADCHVNPANFATFECITCHEHNQTDMDAKHSGRTGYEYLSTACYTCHPRGTH